MTETLKNRRNHWHWSIVALIGAFAILFVMSTLNNKIENEVPFSVLVQYLDNNQVEAIVINKANPSEVKFYLKNHLNLPSRIFYTLAPSEEALSSVLLASLHHNKAYKPEIRVENSYSQQVMRVVSFLAPLALNLGFLYLLFVMVSFQRGGSGGGIETQVGQDYQGNNKPISFKDIAGMHNAKEELRQIIESIKEPEKFHRMGAFTPKGVIIFGPPGVGKTLLARAVAGEAGIRFIYVGGSQFVSPFLGVGRMKVNNLFKRAKEQAPCIIFIDEIDSLGQERNSIISHQETNNILNEFLNEMDGFDARSGVIVFASTNRIDVLDKALLRPGRFDRKIGVGMPNIRERKELFDLYASKVKLDSTVDLDSIARITYGFSGADICNLMNEAAIIATTSKHNTIVAQDMNEALQKVSLGGLINKSLTLTDKDRSITAYHESGHAIISHGLERYKPHIVTITPRGYSLGVTFSVPKIDTDITTSSRSELEESIMVAMGGRAAEEIIFGKEQVTNGATSDIAQATKIAYNMVARFGLTDNLGLMNYYNDNPYERAAVSDTSKALIEQEMKTIIDKCYQRTKEVLTAKLHCLHAMADALLEYEILDDKQIDQIMSSCTNHITTNT